MFEWRRAGKLSGEEEEVKSETTIEKYFTSPILETAMKSGNRKFSGNISIFGCIVSSVPTLNCCCLKSWSDEDILLLRARSIFFQFLIDNAGSSLLMVLFQVLLPGVKSQHNYIIALPWRQLQVPLPIIVK